MKNKKRRVDSPFLILQLANYCAYRIGGPARCMLAALSDDGVIAALETKEYLEKKTTTQPLDHPSAGSVFVNPPGFFAGKLIEDCGLKGKTVGGAQVSPKHANFIVNIGDAKTADVLELIAQIKRAVKEKFNIDLKEEIEIVTPQVLF